MATDGNGGDYGSVREKRLKGKDGVQRQKRVSRAVYTST